MSVRLKDLQSKKQARALGGIQDSGHASRSIKSFRTPYPPLHAANQPSADGVEPTNVQESVIQGTESAVAEYTGVQNESLQGTESNDVGYTRVRDRHLQGTPGYRASEPQGTKFVDARYTGVQSAKDQGTNPDGAGYTGVRNAESDIGDVSDAEYTGVQKPLTGHSENDYPEYTGVQKSLIPGTERFSTHVPRVQNEELNAPPRVRKEEVLDTEPLHPGCTRVQKQSLQGTEGQGPGYKNIESRVRKEGAAKRGNRFDKRDIPRASDQLTILLYLRRSLSPEGTTPHLSRSQIAQECMVATNTVKVSLLRLMKKGLLVSVARSFSKKQGGAVFSIPKSVVKLIDEVSHERSRVQNHSLQSSRYPGTEAPLLVVGGKDLTTPTNTPADTASVSDPDEPSVVLKTWVARLGLDHGTLQLGVADLMTGFRQSGLELNQFIKALEHVVLALTRFDGRFC